MKDEARLDYEHQKEHELNKMILIFGFILGITTLFVGVYLVMQKHSFGEAAAVGLTTNGPTTMLGTALNRSGKNRLAGMKSQDEELGA